MISYISTLPRSFQETFIEAASGLSASSFTSGGAICGVTSLVVLVSTLSVDVLADTTQRHERP